MKRSLSFFLTGALLFPAVLYPSDSLAHEPETSTSRSASAAENFSLKNADEKPTLPVREHTDIQRELLTSIRALEQPAKMDVSAVVMSEIPEIEVKNLYYELLRQNPELKYAYDLSAQVQNRILTCQISYMPYKTGAYPADWKGVPIDSLSQLLTEANKHLGDAPLPIRLTDTSLEPDTIQRALQQVGGGYMVCELNPDGTEITYAPALGHTMEECLALLEEADGLAEEIIQKNITPALTERECAETLYHYLIHTVQYDRRYYTDREHMPYDSQTAIGALRDQLAICGGYSHALKLLFEKVGIPCYTVSGTYGQEHHMWNLAFLEGQWLWFDATADRGLPEGTVPDHFALEKLEASYHFSNEELLHLLPKSVP